MSNYADYFGELASNSEKRNEIDFGSVINHKYNRAKRNFLYTHPNQLRSMTTHHNNKISHSKQSDLLGAIEMLAYKPPPILPISDYQKQVYGSGKKKPFNISETEKKSKKKEVDSNKLLEGLVASGDAVVHYDKPKPKIPSGFVPKVKGELSPSEVNKMNEMDKINYAKNMATEYRDKGIKGGYRLPSMKKQEQPKATII